MDLQIVITGTTYADLGAFLDSSRRVFYLSSGVQHISESSSALCLSDFRVEDIQQLCLITIVSERLWSSSGYTMLVMLRLSSVWLGTVTTIFVESIAIWHMIPLFNIMWMYMKHTLSECIPRKSKIYMKKP